LQNVANHEIDANEILITPVSSILEPASPATSVDHQVACNGSDEQAVRETEKANQDAYNTASTNGVSALEKKVSFFVCDAA
jgi:hypothetical protein